MLADWPVIIVYQWTFQCWRFRCTSSDNLLNGRRSPSTDADGRKRRGLKYKKVKLIGALKFEIFLELVGSNYISRKLCLIFFWIFRNLRKSCFRGNFKNFQRNSKTLKSPKKNSASSSGIRPWIGQISDQSINRSLLTCGSSAAGSFAVPALPARIDREDAEAESLPIRITIFDIRLVADAVDVLAGGVIFPPNTLPMPSSSFA